MARLIYLAVLVIGVFLLYVAIRALFA